jgi:methylase of polypeptide subunit release factors
VHYRTGVLLLVRECETLVPVIDASAAAQVRQAFLDASFTVTGLRTRLGEDAWAALGRDEHVAVVRSLDVAQSDPLSSFARMFVLGQTITAHPKVPVDALVTLGLAAHSGEHVAPLVEISPYGQGDLDWWVVSDLGHAAGRELRSDHVLGVGGASSTLAHLTPRTAVDSSLDIGTGCGVQALHLAQHSRTVVATDTNARALWATQISAALSDITLETRRGSFLDPVVGERFDLIVSNPPFVISPKATFEYRDAGLAADDVGRLLVRDLPSHLHDGGTAVLLANWLHVRGQDWQDRVGSWAAGTGYQAWIVQRDFQDCAQYVGSWMRDATSSTSAMDERVANAWLDGLESLNAGGVGFGWIVLHRTDAQDPPVVVEDLTSAPRLPDGAEVLSSLGTHSALADLDAFALLSVRLQVCEGVVIQPEEHRTADGWFPGLTRLRRASGWRPPVEVDHLGAAFVRACDGTTSVDQIVGDLSDSFGLDQDDVLAGSLITARALIAEGILSPT